MFKSALKLTFIVISVAFLTAGHQAQFYPAGEKDAPDRYIVVLRKSVNQFSDIVSLSARLSDSFGIAHAREISIGDFRALIIKTERERVTSLLNEAEIDYIEQDKPVEAIESHTSGCPEYPIEEFGQWGLARIDSRNAIDLECDGSFACNYTSNNTYSYSDLDNGTDIYVYVVDSGIRIEHDDFGGRAEHGYVVSTIDEEHGDLLGHGTHVASIAIGEKYGVAKGARAVAVKVLNGTGEGSFIGIVEGIEWVVNETQTRQRKGVCNLSLGGLGRYVALEDAIRSALSLGIPFANSAGNDQADSCVKMPSYLGKDTAAITVGATTPADELAIFSNYGECVSILAPGVYIKAAGIANNSEYTVKSGTSMATPVVAGVVARLMSREQSSLTPWGIKLWLIESATRDAISMGSIPTYLNTTNRLLYFNCDLPYVEMTTPTTAGPLVCKAGNKRMANIAIIIASMVAILLQI